MAAECSPCSLIRGNPPASIQTPRVLIISTAMLLTVADNSVPILAGVLALGAEDQIARADL